MMSNEKYVTVIPVEYPRSNRYLQPPHQYSDFADLTSNSYDRGELSEYEKIKDSKQDHGYIPSANQNEDATLKISKEPSVEYHMDISKGLHVCVYLMNDIVLHMELEDGTNTTVTELVDAIINIEELNLPPDANSVFTLWMSSGLLGACYQTVILWFRFFNPPACNAASLASVISSVLFDVLGNHKDKLIAPSYDGAAVIELQLKPEHKPLLIRSKWANLLSRFAHASISRQQRDEPILSFQRNACLSLSEEEKIVDGKLLELLYEEAKYNILEGRYPCEISQCILLGGIHARLELGPYNPQFHTNNFFRVHRSKFLPYHARHKSLMSWFRLGAKDSPEFRLLEHFKRIPNSASDKKLQRRYLEICWNLPYYGSAFFQGQIEEPVKGLASLLLHEDMPMLVAINERGVCLIDNIQSKLFLSLKYEDFSWEMANPCKSESNDCLPCIFFQFMVIENGIRVSKILQVFSKQAVMMDALISVFVKRLKDTLNAVDRDEVDSRITADYLGNLRSVEAQTLRLPSQLSKLTLATFDEQGQCIGQTGSLAFDYKY